jgi:hypothetical protein
MFAKVGITLALTALACNDEGTDPRPEATPAASTPSSNNPLTPAPASVDANGDLLLDDLTDQDAHFTTGEVSGEWFTYSDGTGSIEPLDHTGLPTVDGEAHVSGRGFSDWGAGLSAYLTSARLTDFSSLVLRAKGSGLLVIELATPSTSPPDEGGTCLGEGCFGHFAGSIELSPEYQDFELPFATLAQPSWAQPAELSLDRVISLNFVAKVAGAPIDLELWVDRLSLRTTP